MSAPVVLLAGFFITGGGCWLLMIQGRVAEDGEQVESNLDSEQQQQDRREGYTITMDIFSGVHVLCRSLEQSRASTQNTEGH